MSNPLQPIFLFLILALGTAPVLAQQPAAARGKPAAPAPASAAAAEKATAAQPAPAANKPAQKSAPAASSKDSPFDYRSSEEISEDVSVSFPVDI